MEKLIRNRRVVSIALLILSFWMLFTNLFNLGGYLGGLVKWFGVLDNQKLNVLFFKEFFKGIESVSWLANYFGVIKTSSGTFNVINSLFIVAFYMTIAFFVYTIYAHLMNRETSGTGYFVCLIFLMAVIVLPFICMNFDTNVSDSTLGIMPSFSFFVCLGSAYLSQRIYKKDTTKPEMSLGNLDSFFDEKNNSSTKTFNNPKEKEWICSCGNKNEAKAKFCSACGKERVIQAKMCCPSCRAEIIEGSKFCTNCGRDLSDLVSVKKVERKNVETPVQVESKVETNSSQENEELPEL